MKRRILAANARRISSAEAKVFPVALELEIVVPASRIEITGIVAMMVPVVMDVRILGERGTCEEARQDQWRGNGASHRRELS